jgi:hypothetical protein
MNKLKTIGISALAGTLVSLSAAQAGGVSVSGSWELSYTNLNKEKVTGNKIGMNKNISFGASGDISDGGGVTWSSTIGGSDAMGLSSASIAINMGGIATLSYDSGTGGYGANAVDNVVPTAWEEIDYGFDTGLTDVGRVSGSKGVATFSVNAPVAGTGFSISYVNRMRGGHISDGATGGDTGSGSGVDVVLDFINYKSAHFDLRYGLAVETEMPEVTCHQQSRVASDMPACLGPKDNPYAGTMYFTTQLGPLHLGTQATFKNPQESADSGILNKRTIVAGGALVFGDTLSLSYGEAWDKYRYNDRNRGKNAELGGVDAGSGKFHERLGPEEFEYQTVRFRGYSAALNIGPVALKGVRNYVSGAGENASSQAKHHSELNLSIAF